MATAHCTEVAKPVVSLYFASMTAKEVSKNMNKQHGVRREPRSSGEGIKLRKLAVDESSAMRSLMKRAAPVFAPRCGMLRPDKDDLMEKERERDREKSPFEELLERGIEEGIAKIQYISKLSPESGDAVRKGEDDTDTSSETPSSPTTNSLYKQALEVWTEEESAQGCVGSGTHSFHTSHSLVSALDRGRFPLDANLTVTRAVKRVEEDLKNSSSDGNHSTPGKAALPPTVKGKPGSRLTLLDRLRKIPVRSWDLLYNITTSPDTTDSRKHGRKYYMEQGPLLPKKWRHRFDYVNYKQQFELDESLCTRDVCRNMVIRHEKRSSLKPPMAALADVFEQQESAKCRHAKHRKNPRNDDAMWCSVWGRRANEIALERQRERIINAVKEFKLCVEAANLSRVAVGRLQKDLIKVIQEWPSDYRKRHIFTTANFEEWVKTRCAAPSAGESSKAAHLAESMASTAEASFVEYVLTILPPGQQTRPGTR